MPHQELFYGFSWSPGNYTPDDLEFDEREIVVKSCEKAHIKPVFSDMNETDFPVSFIIVLQPGVLFRG